MEIMNATIDKIANTIATENSIIIKLINDVPTDEAEDDVCDVKVNSENPTLVSALYMVVTIPCIATE
jgi:hypothetical protein